MTPKPAPPAPSPARRAAPPRRVPGAPRPFPVIPIGIGVVMLLAAVAVAVGVAGGGGGSGSPAGVAQSRPVRVTGGALPPFASTAADPAVGRAAPAVEGASFDGTPVAIAPDGQPKLVVFLAHWCPHCQHEVPVLVDWTAGGAPQSVRLYAVSTSVDESRPNWPPSAWLDEDGWTVPTLADDADGTVGSAFGLPGFPYFVAVDRGGKVVARASGEQSRAQLEALAAMARG